MSRIYLTVIDYDPHTVCHVCTAEEFPYGVRVDLHVDGIEGLPAGKDLIGARVSVDHLQPYVTIGVDVKREDG